MSDAVPASWLLPIACGVGHRLADELRRQVYIQYTVEIDDDHAFNRVAQLAHISRP